MEILKPSSKSLNSAIKILRNGGIVICPTDTVYGFLADASNKKAVAKIYKIKKRAKSKPLSLFVKDITMAKGLAEIDGRQLKTLKKYWPGKYTFILKRNYTRKLTAVKKSVYGISSDTIALRIPKYKFLNDLLKKIDRPLVQTSVNISGESPFLKMDDIISTFNTKDILFINGGNIKKGKPSRIIDLTHDKINILRK